MEKELKKKLSALNPDLKKQLEEMMKKMHISISILYEAATKDEKTGLYNSRFFNNVLEMEIEKVQRGKQKLSLMAIDIDFFKKVNDLYGHIKADELLMRLAKVIQGQIRKYDIAARFGGEEFFILLPETPLSRTSKLAERLRKKIKSDAVLAKHSITISIGVTEFKTKDTKKSFLSRVDKALYSAKKQGRDRFISLG